MRRNNRRIKSGGHTEIKTKQKRCLGVIGPHLMLLLFAYINIPFVRLRVCVCSVLTRIATTVDTTAAVVRVRVKAIVPDASLS